MLMMPPAPTASRAVTTRFTSICSNSPGGSSTMAAALCRFTVRRVPFPTSSRSAGSAAVNAMSTASRVGGSGDRPAAAMSRRVIRAPHVAASRMPRTPARTCSSSEASRCRTSSL